MFGVFAGTFYYPGRGWNDFEKSFKSFEEALEFAKEKNETNDWSQIVNLNNECIVWDSTETD